MTRVKVWHAPFMKNHLGVSPQGVVAMLVVSCLAIAANAQLRQSPARAPERNPGARPSGDRSTPLFKGSTHSMDKMSLGPFSVPLYPSLLAREPIKKQTQNTRERSTGEIFPVGIAEFGRLSVRAGTLDGQGRGHSRVVAKAPACMAWGRPPVLRWGVEKVTTNKDFAVVGGSE